ncbi:hypothetical protein JCM8547_001009 [Rhodosporidiobolus lusitaniae]
MSAAPAQQEWPEWMKRDYIGYGQHPPNPHWPEGKRVAISFVLNYEEGGERCVEDGDAHAETVLHEFGNLLSAPLGERDPATESQFMYGSRVATWRVMSLFKKHNIPITWYAVALAFERNPEIAKYAEENGHEVASHCYKWMPYTDLTREEEKEYIKKAVLSFQKTSPTGKVPRGWYYGRPSARSVPLVAEVYKEMGHELKWWSDTYADDLPYYVPHPSGGDKPLTMVPYSLDCNDFKLWLPGGVGNTESWAEHVMAAIKTIAEEAEAGERYGMVTIALHGRWIGRPGRFQSLKKIVETAVARGDCWFATREQISDHFNETVPYKPEAKQ